MAPFALWGFGPWHSLLELSRCYYLNILSFCLASSNKETPHQRCGSASRRIGHFGYSACLAVISRTLPKAKHRTDLAMTPGAVADVLERGEPRPHVENPSTSVLVSSGPVDMSPTAIRAYQPELFPGEDSMQCKERINKTVIAQKECYGIGKIFLADCHREARN